MRASLLEVDLAAVVRVEGAEHVRAELVGVALREETGVDLEELGAGQLAVWTVFLYIVYIHVDILHYTLSIRLVCARGVAGLAPRPLIMVDFFSKRRGRREREDRGPTSKAREGGKGRGGLPPT